MDLVGPILVIEDEVLKWDEMASYGGGSAFHFRSHEAQDVGVAVPDARIDDEDISILVLG